MTRDWKKFPELRNKEMDMYYLFSPHKQITEGFLAKCERVIDGDTLDLSMRERNFFFPLRMLRINTKEIGQGGEGSKEWMKQTVEGKEVYIGIDKFNRVGKFGRLLGEVNLGGINLNDQLLDLGFAEEFEDVRLLSTPDSLDHFATQGDIKWRFLNS